jgi:flagellar basal-body rod protein FlgG
MINAFHTAISGVNAYQQSLNIVSNNMANAATIGFKAERADFTDLIYQNLAAGNPGTDGGSGSKIIASTKNLAGGAAEQTGRILDFSITGDGYFAVAKRIPSGGNAGNANNTENTVIADTDTISYTRAGNFSVAQADGKNYLVTQNGEFVLNDKLETIILEGDINNIVFTSPIKPEAPENPPAVPPAGQTGEDKALTKPVSIGIFGFGNPYALIGTGDNKFSNVNAGAAEVLYSSKLSQQTLERSNIDIIAEMQRMITAQRGFELSSRVIQTADEMEQIANTLSN